MFFIRGNGMNRHSAELTKLPNDKGRFIFLWNPALLAFAAWLSYMIRINECIIISAMHGMKFVDAVIYFPEHVVDAFRTADARSIFLQSVAGILFMYLLFISPLTFTFVCYFSEKLKATNNVSGENFCNSFLAKIIGLFYGGVAIYCTFDCIKVFRQGVFCSISLSASVLMISWILIILGCVGSFILFARYNRRDSNVT